MKTTAVAGLLLAWSRIAFTQSYTAPSGVYINFVTLSSLQEQSYVEPICEPTVTATVYPSFDIDPFIISHLGEFGQEFCTSYNSYTAPTVTAEPTTQVITRTAAGTTTQVVTVSSVAIVTSTRGVAGKRDFLQYRRSPHDYDIVVEAAQGEYKDKPTPIKRHVEKHAKKTPVADKRSNYGITIEAAEPELKDKPSPAKRELLQRQQQVSTPAPVASFPPYLISAACSSVATGNITVNRTTSIPPRTTTATPVSTSYTTMFTTATVPGIVLASPTPLIGDVNGSPENYDDRSYNLSLPFPIGAYGVYTSNMWLSTNGVITVTSERDYNNRPLPAADVPSLTIFAYWTDLYIRQGYPQGIYYEVVGPVGGRNLTFEFYTTRRDRWEEYYHFTVAFYEAMPGVIDLRYYDMSNNGNAGTVGVQDRTANRFLQYAHRQPIVSSGLRLRLDTTGTSNGTITVL